MQTYLKQNDVITLSAAEKQKMENTKDKVAIITGASSGLGEAIAYHFAKNGYKLSLIGRSKEKLETVVEKCLVFGLAKEKAIYLTGDITDGPTRKDLIDNTISSFGRIDVLINNAGVLTVGMCSDTSESEYRRVIETNQTAPYLLTQLAIPHLKESKGNIGNVSSICSNRVTSLGLSAYSMSKAAMNIYTQYLALELAPDGVRANCISPGSVPTSLGRNKDGTVTGQEQWNARMARTAQLTPLERNGTPEEIAEVVGFIASDKAAYMTGENLVIDGGRQCMCNFLYADRK